MLNRNPKHRLGYQRDAAELKEHPFFNDIDWQALLSKKSIPPFKPTLKSETDTSNFDPEFTNAPMSGSLNERAAAAAAGQIASTPLSPTMQANFRGFTFVDESSIDDHFGDRIHDRMDEDMDRDSSNGWNSEDQTDTPKQLDSDDENDRNFNRMSGVVKHGDNDDHLFNNGGFEM